MSLQSITPPIITSLPPALIIQALHHLDEGGQREISSWICDLIRKPNAWTKRLAVDLLAAIQEEMAEQADEACWLEREESRHEFQSGRY